ncbi:MAG: type II toxin-antitoxin system VapB family antitoxin [Bifidobacteriaceae bacterium]|jgi:antitoxin VapB|nr:type II toxin-antitoxin system VapB family antitoxin [Bifidobacteriaceae bacterium]
MALNIKDPETDRLARELATEAGESITEATKTALIERLERLRAAEGADSLYARLMAISARGRARPVLDDRTPDEIIGYNDIGVPE